MSAILLFPLASLPLLAASAVRMQPVHSGAMETLDGCGLRIKTFRECKAIPTLPLDCGTATDTATGQKVEVYRGPDFWRKEQTVGGWSGAGMSLTVYELKYSAAKIPPVVSRDRFAKWAEENTPPAEPDMAAWIKAVSRLDATPSSTKLKGDGDVVVTPCDCAAGAVGLECYLVSSAKAGRTLFCVYKMERGKVDVDKSRGAIKASVQSIGFFAPKVVVVKQQANSAVSGKRNYSPEYLASKQKVIDSIQNLKGWWFLETENYVLVSNQKNRQALDVVRKDMERARAGFESVYPILGPLKAVSVIRVPGTRAEYLAYVGPELKWSGGVWMPSKNELVISDAEGGEYRDKARWMRKVILHEGFHQYLSYAAGETNVWFNEGHAQFFEGMDFANSASSSFRVNCLPDDSALVTRMANSNKINLRKLLAMSHADFYLIRGSEKERAEHYALAWGLVYYLNKGALCSKKTESYTEIPLRYYLTIIRTHDPKAAMAAALEGVDVEKLERDLVAFWKDSGSLVRRSASQPFVKERKELLKKLQALPEFAPPVTEVAAAGS